MTETTEVEPDTGEWTPLPERRVAVLPHTLSNFDHFDDAVASMSVNGALTVWRWGDNTRRGAVPIKIYAPGAWVTVEHLGGGYDQPDPMRRVYPSVQEWARQQPAQESPEIVVQTDPQADDEPAPRSHADDPDPIGQLSPEALEREHGDIAWRSRRVGELVKPGEDGEDAAYRRSADSRPLPEQAADTGGPDSTVDTASGGRGVAQAVARAIVRLWGRLWSARPRTADLRLGLQHLWVSDRAWVLLVLTTAPLIAYLSLSS